MSIIFCLQQSIKKPQKRYQSIDDQISWTDVRTFGKRTDSEKDSFSQCHIAMPILTSRNCLDYFSFLQPLQTLLCQNFACESFCFVEATLLHLDGTIIISQQQKAECSIRLSLTDITHLITEKLKENMQRGFSFPSLSSFKKNMNKLSHTMPDLSN